MTTICFDKKGVAWDGLATCGERIASRSEKKVVVIRDQIFGFTGLQPLFPAAIKWYEDGMTGPMPKSENDDRWWALIIASRSTITRGVALRICSGTPGIEEHPLPFAAGCGADYAFGAMWFGEPGGADALKAVTMVAANTVHSGGEPQYLAYDWVWPGIQVDC